MGSDQRNDAPRTPDNTTRVRGVSTWIEDRHPRPVELNTHDDLAIDPERTCWVVSPVVGRAAARLIHSSSPEVRRFVGNALAAKREIAAYCANRYRPHPGLPKPTPKPAPALPPHAPVPCPLCRPNATPDQPGETWPDCDLCNGEGVVTARRAAEWRDEFA